MAVARGETADDARAGDGGVYDGDDVGELGLEDGVKVGGGGKRGEAVSREGERRSGVLRRKSDVG